MCSCSHQTSKSINDDDINYYNSDASSRSSAPAVSVPSDSKASPDLENYDIKNHRRRHAVVAPNIHHVRHENHYVKNPHITRAQRALYAYKSSLRGASSRTDNHLYTSHHRPRGHHTRMHHHSNKNMHKHQSRGKGRLNSLVSSSYKPPPMFVETRSSRNNISLADDNHKRNRRIKDRTVNSLEPLFISTTSAVKSSKTTMDGIKSNFQQRAGSDTYSKTYFEELLNTYKSHSPYYAGHQKDSSQLVKSLSVTSSKCSEKKCENEKTKEDSEYYYYDYEDEDEDEDDDDYDEDVVDNAEAQGDAGYSTTARPIFLELEITNSSEVLLSNKNNKNHSQHTDKIGSTDTAFESSTERISAKKESQKADASRLATSHIAKIRREGSCFTPKPKMILASNDPSKQYTPHCTILHRCGDDVGCCLPTQTCAASKNSTVELYFFVQTVGSRPSIERLSFINHTECACFSRNDSPQGRMSPTSTSSPQMTAPICACPSLFQRVIDDENRCICDCSSSDTQCDQFKRGLEHFSMENRRCIKNGHCNEPLCEYGHYNKAKGKCPTREEKLSMVHRRF